MTKQAVFIFDMGDEVKDAISGYQGYVIGRFEYMTGCNHYGIEAKTKEGEKTPYESVDEQRLILVQAGAVSLVRDYKDPQAAAVRRSPGRAAPKSPQRPG